MELDLATFKKIEILGWIFALTIIFFFFGYVLVFFGVCLMTRAVFIRFKNFTLGRLETKGKTVLITGCDSGFGLGLAKRLHSVGFTVVATCLRLDSPGGRELEQLGQLCVLTLDISSDDSVARCVSQVTQKCQHTGLWGLVNNAGQNHLGDIELTPMSQYLEIANINMFGMVRMTRACLPLLRQAKGRVINVTSVKGLFAIPSNAAYTMTKFGGEAFSETLAQEMSQYGVTVSIVEPGNFGGTTGCLNKAGLKKMKQFLDEQWHDATPQVKDFFGQAHVQQELEDAKKSANTGAPTIEPVLEVFEDALRSHCPQFRYLVDGSASFIDIYNWLARMRPYLPQKLFDKVRGYFFPYNVYQSNNSKHNVY